ncbi:hypothetical protein VE23_01265 [Paenibacillus sp. D9]|nr:hypothetical protein VE23_01265 [Paenibacillus sp. D9]
MAYETCIIIKNSCAGFIWNGPSIFKAWLKKERKLLQNPTTALLLDTEFLWGDVLNWKNSE